MTDVAEPGTVERQKLSPDEREIANQFVEVIRFCNSHPELVEPINVMLEEIGLEIRRIH